jgi:hypothetical protein
MMSPISACDDQCAGVDVSCVAPLSIEWEERPATLARRVRVCVNEQCGPVQAIKVIPTIGGYELEYVDMAHNESDTWLVRLDLLDEAGVTLRSLAGEAELVDIENSCGCRHAKLMVSSDGASLTQTSVP